MELRFRVYGLGRFSTLLLPLLGLFSWAFYVSKASPAQWRFTRLGILLSILFAIAIILLLDGWDLPWIPGPTTKS